MANVCRLYLPFDYRNREPTFLKIEFPQTDKVAPSWETARFWLCWGQDRTPLSKVMLIFTDLPNNHRFEGDAKNAPVWVRKECQRLSSTTHNPFWKCGNPYFIARGNVESIARRNLDFILRGNSIARRNLEEDDPFILEIYKKRNWYVWHR